MLVQEQVAAPPQKNQTKKNQSKSERIRGAMVRHLVAQNFQPYEQILQSIQAQGDIWITSQGEYVDWWQRRENATLSITVSDGVCRADSSLENAVIEQVPGNFLDTPAVSCPETSFSGELWLTIDSTLPHKELLIEILKREGILNFRLAAEGELLLSRQEVGPLLVEIAEHWQQRQGRWLEADISAVRQLVIDKLAAYHLPLLRIWYHPRQNGVVSRAVFSPRYDVDRAITNLARIRAMERKYGVSSTLYLRSFCPFYGDGQVEELAAKPWCSEIALHGEFVTNARRYGDEFKAAAAEVVHLERLTGRPILGVGMHGGELAYNRSEQTDEVMQQAGLLYDTTPRPGRYYFPFKKMVKGQLGQSYCLAHASSDVDVPANQEYGRVFYERTMAKMNEIKAQNGVFVLMLHPEYFGFFAYLFRPVNWPPLFKFSAGFFKQSLQRG